MKISKKNNLIRPIVLGIGILLLMSILLPYILSYAKQGERVIEEFDDPFISLAFNEKIPLAELEAEFPTEMKAKFSDGSQEMIPVKWKCECDYEAEQFDIYVFEVVVSDGVVLAADAMPAYVRVSVNGGTIAPELYMAYAENPYGSTTLDAYLGVNRDVVSYLESYENSSYYLGTPYYGNIANGDIDRCLVTNGEGANGVDCGMNCTGFVARVLSNVGGDCSWITRRNNYHYVNAVNWLDTAHYRDCIFYRYQSISEMLASGRLEKGDIIYFEPDWSRPGADCHIGFFWGNTSDENLFWHSQSWCDNAITEICAKGSYNYVYIIKLNHSWIEEGQLEIVKEAAEYEMSGASMRNAEFGIYRDWDTTDLVGTVTTDVYGQTETLSLPPGSYYIRELSPPEGFVLKTDVMGVSVTNGRLTTCTVKNKSTKVRIVKRDRESGRVLPGAVFTVWDTMGGYTVGEYVTNQNGEVVIKGLAPGTYHVEETTAPRGYQLESRVYEFTIAHDGTINGRDSLDLWIDNTPRSFSIVVHKTDQEGVALSGAEFTLYHDSLATNVHSVVQVSRGLGEFHNLKAGKKYYLKETRKPQGYYGDEDENGNTRIYEIQVQVDERTGEWKYLIDGQMVDGLKIENDTILHMTVINRKGYQMPETGSSQTIISLLMGAGLVVEAVRKKNKG